MRRFLGLALLLLVGVAIYALHPRNRQQRDEPPAPTVDRMAPEPAPRLAVPRAKPDASRDARALALDESTLMQQIRENVRSHPALAEALAREGRRRFDDSADSDERDALLVDALINQQHIGAARSETYYYLDHHPSGRFTDHLLVMTGVHPTPRGPGR